MSFRIHILVWILHGLVHALVNPYGIIIITQGLFVAYLALYKRTEGRCAVTEIASHAFRGICLVIQV